MTEQMEYRVGDESGDLALENSQQAADHALALAQSAERSLLIITRDLDHALYDNEPFIDAISALARGHRMAQIRILLHDSNYVIKHGHRLLTLAQRITSKLEIRKPGREHQSFTEALLLADSRGYLRRPLADRYEGVVNYNAPARSRELSDTFEEIWTHAQPDPQLRRLHL